MENVHVCRNGRVALNDRQFQISEIEKERYLSTIMNSATRKTVKGNLLKLDEYEVSIGKTIKDFSFNECEEFLYSLNSKNIDRPSLHSCICNHYIKKC